MKKATILIFAILIAACGEAPSSDNGNEGNGELPQASKLPAIASIPGCGGPHSEEEEALWPCRWATGFDAIIVARIDEAHVVRSPSVLAYSGYEDQLLDECAYAEPAMKLDLTVLRSIHGSPTVQQSMTVHFGGAQVSNWNPNVMRMFWNDIDIEDAYEAGELDFEDVNLDEIEWRFLDDYFTAGTHIGLGLYFHEETQMWSPTGSTLFSFDDEELIAFQQGGFPCVTAPWREVSLDEFAAGIAACTQSSEAQADNASVKEHAARTPVRYMAAICFDEP